MEKNKSPKSTSSKTTKKDCTKQTKPKAKPKKAVSEKEEAVKAKKEVKQKEVKSEVKPEDVQVTPTGKKDPAAVEIVHPEEIDDYYDFVNFSLEDTSYKTTLNKKFTKRKKYEIPDLKKVKAFIPGTIKKVFVKEGDKVSENDKLLELEAMKMKNILIAPMDGRIKKVNVKQGARVAKNEILVELK